MNTTVNCIRFTYDPARDRRAVTAEMEKAAGALGFAVNGILFYDPVSRHNAGDTAEADVIVITALDWKPQRISRILRRLRAMRETTERENAECGLPAILEVEQATVLADVCAALGMSLAEQRYVVGPAYRLIDDGGEAEFGALVSAQTAETA